MQCVFDWKGRVKNKKESSELFSADKPIELGLQGAPAAADFDGPDAAFGDILEEGWPWNFKIDTGLFGRIDDVLAVITIGSIVMAIVAAVKSAAPVGFFSPVPTTSALHDVIIYHKSRLVVKRYGDNIAGSWLSLVSAIYLFFFKNFFLNILFQRF